MPPTLALAGGGGSESDRLVTLCHREGLLHLGSRFPVVVARLVRIDQTRPQVTKEMPALIEQTAEALASMVKVTGLPEAPPVAVGV